MPRIIEGIKGINPSQSKTWGIGKLFYRFGFYSSAELFNLRHALDAATWNISAQMSLTCTVIFLVQLKTNSSMRLSLCPFKLCWFMDAVNISGAQALKHSRHRCLSLQTLISNLLLIVVSIAWVSFFLHSSTVYYYYSINTILYVIAKKIELTLDWITI